MPTFPITPDAEASYDFHPGERFNHARRTEDGPPDGPTVTITRIEYEGADILPFLEKHCETYLEELAAAILESHRQE